MKVAVLGTGLMGSRLAGRLLKCGFHLIVWNRTREKAVPLSRVGAALADSPASAAESADVVLLMLADPPAVNEVLFGDDGLHRSFRRGLILLDMSTVDPEFSETTHQRCRDSGVSYFDAPVLGSLKPAEEGTLQIFVGGNEESLLPARSVLNSLGRAVYYLGRPGAGSAMKMAMNLYLGVSMAAVAELVTFARNSNISDTDLLRVVQDAPIFDESKKGKLKRIVESGDWSPTFPLKWMAKDFRLITRASEGLELDLPVASVTCQIFNAAEAHSLGELDYSTIVRDYVRVVSFLSRPPEASLRTADSLRVLLWVLEKTRALTHRVLDQFPREYTERRPRPGMLSCVQLVMRIAVIERTVVSGIRDQVWNPESLAIPEVYHYETAVDFLRQTRSETLSWLSQNADRLDEMVRLPSGRELSVAQAFLDLADREASLRGQIMAYGLLYGARFRDVPL